MSPEEHKHIEAANLATARQMEELEHKWVEEIHQVEVNIAHLRELRGRVAKGTTSTEDMVEAVDFLRCGVSPDDKDVLNKVLDSDDLSSDGEKDRKVVMGMKRKRTGKDARKEGKTKLVKAPEGWTRFKDGCKWIWF
jgi:hypothetical protein